MDTFFDSLTRWQPFFTTTAGVSATLAGLLFVSLSINRERITATGNRALLRLARRSFGDFMFALFIALMFLMPTHGPGPLAIPLMGISIFRGIRMVHAIATYSKTSGTKSDKAAILRNYAFQSATSLGLLFAAIEIYRENASAIYALVPIVAFLLYNGSVNAWQLLLMEKGEDEQPAGEK